MEIEIDGHGRPRVRTIVAQVGEFSIVNHDRRTDYAHVRAGCCASQDANACYIYRVPRVPLTLV